MRDRKKREETGNHDDGEGEDEERLDDTVALRLSEEHGEEKSSDEDIAEVEDNTSVDSSEEEEWTINFTFQFNIVNHLGSLEQIRCLI